MAFFVGRIIANQERGMATEEILFHDVSFAYEPGAQLLLARVNLHLPIGWTGVVGANGTGKTTLLRLATGELPPLTGEVITGPAIYCAQRTDFPPRRLDQLLADPDSLVYTLRGRLGIGPDWLARWQTLSHGERKRAQIGAALWQNPGILAVDEPTNHLDAAARSMLLEALRCFRGIGLLVSHDRELLDGLCQQCLFVDPPAVRLRPGGYARGLEQEQLECETTRRQRNQAGRMVQRLECEAARRREAAARSDQRRSKRNLGKDNDARFRRNKARITGKDGVDGRLLRQLDGRLDQARQRQAAIRVRKQRELGIWVDGGRSRRDLLFRLTAGQLSLGVDRWLHHPDLVMRPQDRVALVGPNGVGKSMLIERLTEVFNLPAEQVTYVPQEIDVTRSRQILVAARGLQQSELGRLMTVVSCLGSDPERLLGSELPSPGEVRKLLLAFGVARIPHLIVMDEPTNHLDLPSIECLEEALARCPCGLLLVSHDERFLRRLTRIRWVIARQDSRGGDTVLRVHI
jgi:macrolide transport system ATP-binding/permease protein